MKNLILLCFCGVAAWAQTSTTSLIYVGPSANLPNISPTVVIPSVLQGVPTAMLLWTPGSINDGSCKTNTVILPPAKVGKTASVGVLPVLANNIITDALVSASGIVLVTICNFTGSTVNLSSFYLFTVEASN